MARRDPRRAFRFPVPLSPRCHPAQVTPRARGFQRVTPTPARPCHRDTRSSRTASAARFTALDIVRTGDQLVSQGHVGELTTERHARVQNMWHAECSRSRAGYGRLLAGRRRPAMIGAVPQGTHGGSRAGMRGLHLHTHHRSKPARCRTDDVMTSDRRAPVRVQGLVPRPAPHRGPPIEKGVRAQEKPCRNR